MTNIRKHKELLKKFNIPPQQGWGRWHETMLSMQVGDKKEGMERQDALHLQQAFIRRGMKATIRKSLEDGNYTVWRLE